MNKFILSLLLTANMATRVSKPILFLSRSTRFALLLSIGLSYQIQAIISMILKEIVY